MLHSDGKLEGMVKMKRESFVLQDSFLTGN